MNININFDTVEHLLFFITIATVITLVIATYFFIKKVNKIKENGVK